MARINIFFIYLLTITCSTNRNFISKMKFQGMDPNIAERGIAIPCEGLEAFYPGFNIRVYCKNCNLVSNNNYGFKGELGNLYGDCFAYDYCLSRSKCKKCFKEQRKYKKIVNLSDIVFSRCNYEWDGSLLYSSKGKSDFMIFDDDEKTTFHTPIFKLNKEHEYMLYDKERFIWYTSLSIRCTKI